MGSRTQLLTREEVLDVIKELNSSQIGAIKAANERYKDNDQTNENVQESMQADVAVAMAKTRDMHFIDRNISERDIE